MATLGAAVETAATLHQGISAVAASFYRERVNSGASRSFRQRATDFPTARTEREQPTDQQVERDRGIGSLELGDARLARPEARGERREASSTCESPSLSRRSRTERLSATRRSTSAVSCSERLRNSFVSPTFQPRALSLRATTDGVQISPARSTSRFNNCPETPANQSSPRRSQPIRSGSWRLILIRNPRDCRAPRRPLVPIPLAAARWQE